MKKISVVIPTFNRQNFILVAVDSVLKQTYRKTEIIVVDDGSTDSTKMVLQPLIDAGKIKYIYIENGGPAKARNVGIRHSTGEYIAFLDSDDIWLEDKLKTQMDYFIKNPDRAVVHCDLLFVNVDGSSIDVLDKGNIKREGWIFESYLMMKSWVFLSCLVVSRKVLDEVGGFEEELFTAEDTNLFLRIAMKFEYGFIDIPLVRRVVHGSNLSLIGVDNAGTFKNLDLICAKFSQLRPDRSKLMKKAYELRYVNAGISCFRMYRFDLSRKFLINALKINHLHFLAVYFLLLTFLPKKLIKFLKSCKQR